jgi:DNA-binding response OmpR family regulator
MPDADGVEFIRSARVLHAADPRCPPAPRKARRSRRSTPAPTTVDEARRRRADRAAARDAAPWRARAGKRVAGGTFGDVVVDLANRTVTAVQRRSTYLVESAACAVVAHPGKVLTRALREVWGPSHIEHSHYLRIYMAHLRESSSCNPPGPVIR